MRRCKKCNKKGLFLKIEDDTGLCLSCNEDFAREGKTLTEIIIEAKNLAATAKDPGKVAKLCGSVEEHGRALIALHEAYNLEPSQELLDLIATHKKLRELAER